ncbi:hypothetical protein [Amphibacillus sediminis]|uniref:hypothetical protein n=1 Tax=Amphibacillus sediminis TaxID=360185 RepID=UPI00082F3CFC
MSDQLTLFGFNLLTREKKEELRDSFKISERESAKRISYPYRPRHSVYKWLFSRHIKKYCAISSVRGKDNPYDILIGLSYPYRVKKYINKIFLI